MSYQVLARKYRPANFQEMEGQEHVLRALVNALEQNRLHHAYLFTGTRGVGKTTIARILARCLNCETGVTATPCGDCSSCQEIAQGRSVDLIEVDAASRTRVEDTRELLDNVQYMPTRSRFKVYLIDEVHMLSNHSFNALLKTLEEPPEHVKFLLATTDPKKLPVTVLSRCLQFNLKNLSPERVVHYLKQILAKEQIEFEEAALWQLGRAADGSMRDALSLTDQAISFGENRLAEADVRLMLGTIDHREVYDLLDALIEKDAARLLNRIAELAEFGPDYEMLLAELLRVLHRVAVAQAVPGGVDNSQGDLEQVLAVAKRLGRDDVQLYYQIGLIGQRDLPLAPDARDGFEMVMLRMLAFAPAESLGPPDDSGPGGPGRGRPEHDSKPDESSTPAAVQSAATQPATPQPAAPQPAAPQPATPQPATPQPATPQPATSPDSPIKNILSRISGSGQADGVSATPPISTKAAAVPSEPAAGPAATILKTAEAVASQDESNEIPFDSDEIPFDASPSSTPAARPSTPPEAPPPAPAVASAPAVAREVVAHVDRAPQSASEIDDPDETDSPGTVSAENWCEVFHHLGLTGVTRTLAANCILIEVEPDMIALRLEQHHASLWNETHEKRIAAALTRFLAKRVGVRIETGPVERETPAQATVRQTEEKRVQAVSAIENDSNVQQLLETFDGKLNVESIVPRTHAGE